MARLARPQEARHKPAFQARAAPEKAPLQRGVGEAVPEKASLQRGIGVHHHTAQAALTGISHAKYTLGVEYLFRLRHIQIVLATGTLAQGINMPARSVVLASDSNYLHSTSYLQMAGRAGRRGYDLRGNVVHFCLPRSKVLRLQLDAPTLRSIGEEVLSVYSRAHSQDSAVLENVQ